MHVHPEVAAALRERRPVVALESSVFAQGLAPPANREAHKRMVAAVRAAGAVPAITGVSAGAAIVGLDDAALERFFNGGAGKASARDLGWAIASGADAATTVAATLVIAAAAGIEVAATGGIGGVHRGAPFDESADVAELGRRPVILACSGAKAILDVPATVERLETAGIAVIGYRTDEFPGFYTARTGIALRSVAEGPDQVARAFVAGRALGVHGGVLVVQPPPSHEALDPALVEQAVAGALAEAARAGVHGPGLTPFLLAAVERATGGASVRANLALLEANARLGAEVSAALARVRAKSAPL